MTLREICHKSCTDHVVISFGKSSVSFCFCFLALCSEKTFLFQLWVVNKTPCKPRVLAGLQNFSGEQIKAEKAPSVCHLKQTHSFLSSDGASFCDGLGKGFICDSMSFSPLYSGLRADESDKYCVRQGKEVMDF